jgi:phosphocarrier protein HPr
MEPDMISREAGLPADPPIETGVYQCLADVVIRNKKGLHSRASALFAKCAERYDAEIRVTKENQSANGGSILGLLMLAADKGSTITIVTEGQEAEDAIDALVALVENKFNEDE